MPERRPRIAIVGGGITGLACALRLQTLAGDRADAPTALLLEASSRLGGKIVSERVGDFVIDAGADIFVERKEHGVTLCRALGLASQLQHSSDRRGAYVLREGALHAASPYDDVGPLVTLRDGMQGLPDAAAAALHDGVARTNSWVRSVRRSANGFQLNVSDGWTVDADALVVALPAPAAAALLGGIASETARALREVTYTSTTTVSIAYPASDVPHALDGYGYWVPDAKVGDVSACTWTSSKIPGRAPEGFVLLRGYVRGGGEADPVGAVRADLRHTLGITAEPLFTRAYPWPEAVPVYGDMHAERVAIIRRAGLTHPGLAIAGSAIDGPGIPDCIRSGSAAADAVWSHLAAA